MTGVVISSLPAASTLTGSEIVPIVQSGTTVRTTLAAMPYVPAGTGAVTTTVQTKLRETVSVKDFGAVGDGVVDDTAAIQAALNSGAKNVLFPAGYTFSVTALNMASGQTIELNGVLKRITGISTDPIILVNNNCSIIGGEIDGNSQNCSGISGVDKSNVNIESVYLHNLGKCGIVSYKSSGSPENWRINKCRVYLTTEQCISIEYTNNCLITNNFIDNAGSGGTPATNGHGIQWWGGDSNTSTTLGIYGLRIEGNICTNVKGGIWGSLGGNIVVTGNHVENCTDVGIDFEGCNNFICEGNVAYECANGCYAVFFGSKNGTFTGNVAKNTTKNGSGFYATTNASYYNENIVISSNVFVCLNAPGISASVEKALTNCTISNNRISCTTNSTIYVSRNTNLQIIGNTLVSVGSGVGIQFQGTSFCTIINNMLYGYSDTNASPATGGGIWMYQQSSTWSCQSNIIRNNRIESYNYSIVDYCPTDVTKSKNDIEWNNVTNVYRSAGGTYNGVIANNVNYLTPATAVTATTF